MNLPAQVRTGSAVRGAGVALACVLPGVSRRASVIAATYAGAWPVDRPGLQFLAVVPDEDEAAWKRAVVPILTSGGSWTLVMSLAALGVRRLPVPAPVAAALLAGAVTVGDSLLADLGDRARAARSSETEAGGVP